MSLKWVSAVVLHCGCRRPALTWLRWPVVMSMDPHHSLTHENLLFLWDILTGWARANTPGKSSGDISLTFTEFLHGMADVNTHEECSGWLDVSKVFCPYQHHTWLALRAPGHNELLSP